MASAPPDRATAVAAARFRSPCHSGAGVDDHLPPVPAHQQTPQALRERFRAPPVWSPEIASEKRFSERALAHASVLVPIVQRDQPTVLLTERTVHLSTHSGQVAFPGASRP